MPEWAEVAGVLAAARQPLPVIPEPEPLSLPMSGLGDLQSFGAQVKVSEQLLTESTVAVRDLILDDLRRAVAAEMFMQNYEPIGDETLDWEADPDFAIRTYRLNQQGVRR